MQRGVIFTAPTSQLGACSIQHAVIVCIDRAVSGVDLIGLYWAHVEFGRHISDEGRYCGLVLSGFSVSGQIHSPCYDECIRDVQKYLQSIESYFAAYSAIKAAAPKKASYRLLPASFRLRLVYLQVIDPLRVV